MPPRKKKDALPEVGVPNIYARPYLKREYKKKQPLPPPATVSYKHFNVGFADGSNLHNPDLPLNAAECYTITNMSRGLQIQESKSTIAFLRKHYGGLIGATESKNAEAENVFSHELPFHKQKQFAGSLSLSVYNRANQLARPKTGDPNILKGVKGLEPV